ncbi:hypothetical protein VTK73DRAFT_1401 [Phialemonium thermophilum]|uniref:VWFA domain-containing protein n=1 Tax=Phialemonium thermophilum TaxID=223376 RepID=A0ABR3XAF6_9PEZI
MVRLPFVSSLISSPSQQEAGLFKHAPLDSLTLEVHPFQSLDGLIVKVQPPKAPAESGKGGAPCDIVLVIDVSGSMQCNAPVPGKAGEQKEDYGLSVLDLTKHAARTILETLGDQDRLGIVVFSEDARVLQKLEPMNAANKKKAQANIEKMTPESSTNLWHGLLEGLKLFNSSGGSGGRVPALMVLTDGMPNHMCPAQGYVPKLRKMEQLPATIHTFGFGYSLRSGLLKSIAEIGGGNYSFIPDAGMIGTVFVHAVANLQSTFARATLRLTYPSYLQLEETMGETVEKQNPVKFEEDGHFQRQLVIPLGNIQYGQSRDIYLRYKEAGELKKLLHGQTEKEKQSVQDPPVIQAVLEYTQFTPALGRAAAQQSILDFTTTMSQAEMDYHMSRSALVSFLATTYPLRRNDEEHVPLQQIHQAKRIELETLIASIPAAQHDDPASESLMADLRGTPLSPAQDGPAQEAQGQVRLALEPAHFARWGAHYLPSLAGAHTRQVCNSFKDPGPLAYGKGSPLFAKCRDRLDAAFDALPPPRPSNPTTYRGKIRMSSYNRSSNPCFAASSVVRLASAVDGKDAPHSGVAEGQLIRIGRLRAGMSVLTPKGPREVAAVLKTRVLREVMSATLGQSTPSSFGTTMTLIPTPSLLAVSGV